MMLILLLAPVAVALSLIIVVLSKLKNSTDITLYGILITILGGILVFDENIKLSGFEYIFVLTGFSIALWGLLKKD